MKRVTELSAFPLRKVRYSAAFTGDGSKASPAGPKKALEKDGGRRGSRFPSGPGEISRDFFNTNSQVL